MMTHPPFPSASLYVGDLASDVSEGHLFDIFNQVGPVSLIRVCRDAVTRRRSLGYAYVNYHNIVDAERALELLNNTPIRGKNCRIMWSQRDPSLRKSGVGNVFVKNLDKSVGHKELLELFSEVGNILSCKVATDPLTNHSRCFGFVHFENPDDAKKAQDKFNGTKVADKELYVGPFLPKKERAPVEDKFTNLFVKNLEEDVDEKKLREMFEVYGKVTSAVVSFEEQTQPQGEEKPKEGEEKSPDSSSTAQSTRKSKCFGFVNFEEHSQAVAAIEGLNLKTFTEGGKQLFVGKAQKKSDRVAELKMKFIQRQKKVEPQGVNLYVRNLDEDYTDDNLRNDFQPFGLILNAKVMRDDKGTSKCYGFVSFRNKEDAQKVLQDFKQTNKAEQPIHVALAHKKNKRPQLRGPPGSAPQNNYYNNNNNQNQGSPQNTVNNTSSRGGRGGSQNSRQNSSRRYNSGGRGGSSAGGYSNNNGQRNNNRSQGGKQKSNNGNNKPRNNNNSNNAPKKVETVQTVEKTQPAEVKEVSPVPAPAPVESPAPAPAPAPAVAAAPAPSTSAALSIDEISEQLYDLIAKSQPNLADKITGMIIDSFPDAKDLAVFLTDEVALQNKIAEALPLC